MHLAGFNSPSPTFGWIWVYASVVCGAVHISLADKLWRSGGAYVKASARLQSAFSARLMQKLQVQKCSSARVALVDATCPVWSSLSASLPATYGTAAIADLGVMHPH